MIPVRVRELSDEQLMRRLDGSEVEAALSKLYDRYSRTVFGVGLKLLGERPLAEELVQEVFLKVWRSAHTFDPSRASFSTWLFRVTRSVALDLHRKRAHRVNPIPNGDSQIVSIKDNSAGPQEVVDESWLSWRVSRALEALDAPHREVIDLAYFGGLSQREISLRIGIPLGTVKTRTARAFKRLGDRRSPARRVLDLGDLPLLGRPEGPSLAPGGGCFRCLGSARGDKCSEPRDRWRARPLLLARVV